MLAPSGQPPEARAPLPPPPTPHEPPWVLRERLLVATRALASSPSLENGTNAVSDAISAAHLLSRAATATSFSSPPPSAKEESCRNRHALECALGDAVDLLNVVINANASSSSSSFALAGAALLLAGCSAASSPAAAVASAAEAATRALLRMADSHPPPRGAPTFFADEEAVREAAVGVGRLAAAAAAAPSSAPAAAPLLLLAFARHAAVAAAASPPIDDSDSDSLLLLPVSAAARMAASTVSPTALWPLLAETATRAAAAAAAAAEGVSSSSPSVASSTFLLAGLAEGAGPRGPLPRELLESIWTACGRVAAAAAALSRSDRGQGGRRSSSFVVIERDAAAAAAVAVAEATSSSSPSVGALFPRQASSEMSAVLVSLICEGRGAPLDLGSLFDAAASGAPPEEAARELSSLRLARSLAPRAARALSAVAPSCPRAEATRYLEGVAAAARRMHEGYAALAAANETNGETTTGASWLSSPALSASGVLRGALNAAFMASVAALRALAVPAGALAVSGGRSDSFGAPPPPPEPRAAAAALDALALVSFARPPSTVIQAHSDLVSSLLEAAAASAPGGGGGGGAIPQSRSVGAALAERMPAYEFFVSPSQISSPSCPPRWVSDALLATRVHFYLLSLAPAARGMSFRGGGEGREREAEAAEAAAVRAAASLALLFVGHPSSQALCGAAHGLSAALMDRGGPLSAAAAAAGKGGAPFLLPGYLDRALDLRGGVRPHFPGLSVAVAAALRGCCRDEREGAGRADAASAAALLVPRRLSAALREALLSSPSPSPSPSSPSSPSAAALSQDSLAIVSALASAMLSVDARGLSDACASAERALSPGPADPAAEAGRVLSPPFPPSSSLPPLPLPLAAAAFCALGEAIGSADDLLRKPALARWWARAASRVGVAAGR